MEAQLPQTREAWLNYVAQRMAPMFVKCCQGHRLGGANGGDHSGARA